MASWGQSPFAWFRRSRASSFAPHATIFVGDTVTIAVSPLDAAGTPMRDVPIRFGIDSGLVMTDGWGTDFVRVVGVAPGQGFVTARFRRATGRVDLVVARCGT